MYDESVFCRKRLQVSGFRFKVSGFKFQVSGFWMMYEKQRIYRQKMRDNCIFDTCFKTKRPNVNKNGPKAKCNKINETFCKKKLKERLDIIKDLS